MDGHIIPRLEEKVLHRSKSVNIINLNRVVCKKKGYETMNSVPNLEFMRINTKLSSFLNA